MYVCTGRYIYERLKVYNIDEYGKNGKENGKEFHKIL